MVSGERPDRLMDRFKGLSGDVLAPGADGVRDHFIDHFIDHYIDVVEKTFA